MALGSIEAYTYQTETLCARCVIEALVGEVPLYGQTEKILDDIAPSMGINREDEGSFDSGDFPKVILGQSLNGETWEHCGSCGDCLDHDEDDCRPAQDQDDMPEHADYPHEPGRLYDCPACEGSCHCDHVKAQYDPSYTQCVFCALLQERHPTSEQEK